MTLTDLERIKKYCNFQIEDIKTWDTSNPATSQARIDELQCLLTFIDLIEENKESTSE